MIGENNPLSTVSGFPIMIRTISPVDGKVVVERRCHTEKEITEILQRAKKSRSALSERIQVANRFLDLLEENKNELVYYQRMLTQGREITMMMGRPIRYTPKEIDTAVMRGRYMVSIAEETLCDEVVGEGKVIKKVPAGIVLSISGTTLLSN